jgi:hypothetical protein
LGSDGRRDMLCAFGSRLDDQCLEVQFVAGRVTVRRCVNAAAPDEEPKGQQGGGGGKIYILN